MNNRAQIMSVDLLIAVGIAVLVWGMLVWNIAEAKTQLREQSTRGERIIQATQTLDILLKTPGSPTGWENASSVNAYGLATRPYVLSSEKVTAFFENDIATIKEAFNLAPAELAFTLSETNGTTRYNVSDINEQRNIDKIVLQRPVLHNGTTKLFTITLQ